jgi:hypothetical protein
MYKNSSIIRLSQQLSILEHDCRFVRFKPLGLGGQIKHAEEVAGQAAEFIAALNEASARYRQINSLNC